MLFSSDLRRFLRSQCRSADRGKSQDVDLHLGVFSGVIACVQQEIPHAAQGARGPLRNEAIQRL